MKKLLTAVAIAIVAATGFGAQGTFADVSPESAKYMGAVLALNDVYIEAGTRVQAAIDQEDYAQLQKEVNTFRVLDAVIGQIEVPDAFAPAHAEVVAAYDDMAQSADLIDLGIETNDPGPLTQAIELIHSATAHIQQATDLLPEAGSV